MIIKPLPTPDPSGSPIDAGGRVEVPPGVSIVIIICFLIIIVAWISTHKGERPGTDDGWR